MLDFANGIQVLSHLPRIDLVPMIALPLFWVVMCVYFCVRSAIFGMPRTARIDKIAKSPYLPRIIMEFGYWMFTLPIAVCLRLGITPNMLTIGSLIVTVAAAVAIGLGHFSVGGWTLFLAFMMDAWDGIVARQTGVSSIAGEFLDATIDRYNDLLGFLGLMYYYRNDPLPLILATLALIGSTLVSYTRAKGEAVGVDPNVGWMQRHERAVYLGISTVLAPVVAAFVEGDVAHPQYHLTILALGIMAFATNTTAIWRARFVLDGLRKKNPEPQPQPEPETHDDAHHQMAAVQ
jgi:CDP-diacylglycerol--glycerol-3-phosphate 3-phosphatidyltransferase